MEVPKTKTLCDQERFVEGLRILAAECNLSHVYFNAFGVTRFVFKDGGVIGNARAFINAGYISEEEFDRKRLK